MASYVNLANIAEGSYIRIQEKTKIAEYLVLQHGYRTLGGVPQTLVTRRYLAETYRWASPARDDYDGSGLQKQVSAYPSNFMPAAGQNNSIAGYIPTVSIQVRNIGGSISNLDQRVFVLSKREVGLASSGPGTQIPYFNSNARRQAQDGANYKNQVWWLRDPTWCGIIKGAEQVNKDGKADDAWQTDSGWWYRPTFCLPANITVETSNNNYTRPNTSPVVTGTVSVSKNPIKTWEGTFTVSWTAATDRENPASGLTYIVQKSYNNGATWMDAAVVQGTNATQVLGYNETSQVKYRVAARDGYCQSLYWIESANIPVISNTPPTTPPTINVGTLPLIQSCPVTVSWGASSDADNNLAGYRLYVRVDGGAWGMTPVYDGGALAWSGTLGEDWNTVQYRVCAYDGHGEVSGWRESTTYTLKPLVIITVGQHASSGIKNGSTYTADSARSLMFAVTNTVDPDMAARYTVILKCDGAMVEQKIITITGGVYIYELTKFQWQCILNGPHTYTLTVSDTEGNSGQGSITFTKNITSITIKSVPIFVEINTGIIKNAMMTILGAFPLGSTLLVEITNNANDPVPVWQEILPGQLDGGYFPISNTAVADGNWFRVRVTLNRGTATAACWIGQISGMAGLTQTFILGQENERLRADLDQEIEDREAADLALEDKIEANRMAAFKQKGSKPAFANLPPDPEIGDVWETLDTGDEWYWNGNEWKPYGPTITVDTTPTLGSTNPITSGGVHAAIANETTARQQADDAFIPRSISDSLLRLEPFIVGPDGKVSNLPFTKIGVPQSPGEDAPSANIIVPIPTKPADIGAQPAGSYATAAELSALSGRVDDLEQGCCPGGGDGGYAALEEALQEEAGIRCEHDNDIRAGLPDALANIELDSLINNALGAIQP